ncbi:TRAP transporter fused permease subunit (plasmid) [Pseudorhodobacter turbinis]|uniref:TRAP transporter fused permease subunit n=1 Tax=Pseudorhodobacter turbinis TaxID=2500533 RepID=A0A4P8EKE0_9RHOB|nr:TRAP transporter fused permease subunit [Pseudorhodobacter turbinis]
MKQIDEPQPDAEISRQRNLPAGWRAVVAIAALAATMMVVYMAFNLGLYAGYIPIQAVYFYAALTLLCPLAFILFPAHSRAPKDRVPWYDVILFVVFFGAGVICTLKTRTIFDYGWDYLAPDWALWMALAVWVLMLEATRRSAGLAVFIVVGIASLYPWFGGAAFLGIFQVPTTSLLQTAQYHLYGSESLIGVPLQALVNIVIGFLLFGVALQRTGAGEFFINLSFALLGGTRGGPAKVAILSSGLMGSISGSPVTNVVTTGSMTIPAMRKVGFPAVTAGAIEACASTGGVLMPPVMGATAFIMATYLEISYQTVALAAIIPSFLFFLGLFLQIDAMAARQGLTGIARKDLPKIGAVLRDGWYFLLALALLIWLLFFLKQESRAPFFATLALIALNQLDATRRWGFQDLADFAVACGRLFV